MKFIRTYSTVRERDGVPAGHQFNVEIEIDLDAIARQLAGVATHSRSKKSTALRGAIKCKILQPNKP